MLPEATLIRCDVKATTTSLTSSDPTLNDESLNPQKDADAQQTDAAACLNPQKDADAQQTDAAACLNPQKDADAQQTDAAAFDAKMAWEKVRKQVRTTSDSDKCSSAWLEIIRLLQESSLFARVQMKLKHLPSLWAHREA